MKKLLSDVKKAVVFIGGPGIRRDGTEGAVFKATGVLVRVENIFHLVTAKHVILDNKKNTLRDEELFFTVSTKDSRSKNRSFKAIKQKIRANWIFHTNTEVDLAIIPTLLNPNEDDIKMVPPELFIESGNLYELYDVFFLSFQPGINPDPSEERIKPIIRSGAVSTLNDDKTFFIDGSAYPGNSGSPVFLKPSPVVKRSEDGKISLHINEQSGKFVGIVGEYVPYREVAISSQTGEPRVIFQENTGLSKVWPVDYLEEIIKSNDFQRQLKEIKKLIELTK